MLSPDWTLRKYIRILIGFSSIIQTEGTSGTTPIRTVTLKCGKA